MNEPKRPADKRPNDEPYFIEKFCENGHSLIPTDNDWRDEFHCIICNDGIYLDVPKGYLK